MASLIAIAYKVAFNNKQVMRSVTIIYKPVLIVAMVGRVGMNSAYYESYLSVCGD